MKCQPCADVNAKTAVFQTHQDATTAGDPGTQCTICKDNHFYNAATEKCTACTVANTVSSRLAAKEGGANETSFCTCEAGSAFDSGAGSCTLCDRGTRVLDDWTNALGDLIQPAAAADTDTLTSSDAVEFCTCPAGEFFNDTVCEQCAAGKTSRGVQKTDTNLGDGACFDVTIPDDNRAFVVAAGGEELGEWGTCQVANSEHRDVNGTDIDAASTIGDCA